MTRTTALPRRVLQKGPAPKRFTVMALLLLAAAAMLGAAGSAPSAVEAATLLVTSVGDEPDVTPGDGVCLTAVATCTLRAAIQEANALPGTDTIDFNIPACGGVCTIAPLSTLPDVTGPTIIDGYTQPGSAKNTLATGNNAALRIELNGANAGLAVDGITLQGGSTVRGLIINGFLDQGNLRGNGISQKFVGNNIITGNFIGTNANGTAANSNFNGIFFTPTGSQVNTRIGGTLPEERNLVSGNRNCGLVISTTANNIVQGNYIGTNASGTAAIGNVAPGVCVVNSSSGNTVGGLTAAARNVISGNTNHGIVIHTGANGNLVQGNFIGTQADGMSPLANSGVGVFISGAISAATSNNSVGGTASGSGNTIAFNADDGVRVAGAPNNAFGNAIRGNSIHTNIGKGISNTFGGNTELTPPVITSATGTTVAGTTTCSGCSVDIYQDAVDEGRTSLGSVVAAGNNWSFAGTIAGPNATATVTDVGGNTSEFSLPRAVSAAPPGPLTLVVNSVGDEADAALDGVCLTSLGACTLRAAIQEANAHANVGGPDTINFNITGGCATTVCRITLVSTLPDSTDPVVINGYSQPGSQKSTATLGSNAVLKIEVHGFTGINGLRIHGGSTVMGLVINGFTGDGAAILTDGGNNIVVGSFVGTDASGSVAAPNSYGVYVNTGSNGDRIGGPALDDRNLISGNDTSGVKILSGATATVQGNLIGTNAAGTAAVANFKGANISANNVIRDNVISGNGYIGVDIVGNDNSVKGNFIGTNAAGAASIANERYGVFINSNVSGNTIGGTTSADRNVISGNGAHPGSAQGGIVINTAATLNKVQGNYIGTTKDGTAAVPNSDYGIWLDGATGNQIGGTIAGSGNVISGNSADGVLIQGGNAAGSGPLPGANLVQGNLIGTNSAGTAGVANARMGIYLFESPNNTVGGPSLAERNVISGNGSNGVQIYGSNSSGNKVQGNFIGTLADGASKLGNANNGIHIKGAPGVTAHDNIVGGTTPASGNTIAYNAGDGVRIEGAGVINNAIRGNSIHDNTGSGIRDVNGGNGGNTNPAPPTVTTATGSTASGTLTACPNCFVDVFSDASDEGAKYHTSVTADAGGAWSVSGLSGVLTNVTATATNGAGNTSEFSAPLAVGPATPTTGKLGVVKVLNPVADPGRFDLQIDGAVAGNGANAGHGGATGMQTVSVGVHTIGELATAGTSLSNYITNMYCKNLAGTGAVVANHSLPSWDPLYVNVNPGDEILCTITNTRPAGGQLEVRKVLNPVNDTGRFDLQIDGLSPNPGSQNVGNNGSTGTQAVSTGAHTIGEVATPGTSLGNYITNMYCKNLGGNGAVVANHSGPSASPLYVAVSSGDNIVCTITNTLTGIAPAITSLPGTTFTVGTPGSFPVTATGSPAPAITTATVLPSWLTLTPAGVLSGTPAVGSLASYVIALKASNGVGLDAAQSFALTVNPAANYVVTKTLDTNGACTPADCSLRAAISAANAHPGPDTIFVPAGAYNLTIPGGNEDADATGDLDITGDLTINGAGAALTVLDGAAIQDRVFEVHLGTTVRIDGVTIQNGDARAAGGDGGGIFNKGTLTLTNSIVKGNNGLAAGGIYNLNGTLSIARSAITGNSTFYYAGGIFNHGNAPAVLTLTDSTVSDNVSYGYRGAGLANVAGVVTVNNSTINGNKSPLEGAGGILNWAGGQLNLTNSTVSGNTGNYYGGAISNSNYGGGNSAVTLVNSTVMGNTDLQAWLPGGIFNDSGGYAGTVTLKNSVIAQSSTNDCSGVIAISLGNNIVDDASCGLSGPGDRSSTSPVLGPLTNNGSSSLTHAPLLGSPAINGVPGASCNGVNNAALATDQRGTARPQGGACDVGAVEMTSAELAASDSDSDGIANNVDRNCAGTDYAANAGAAPPGTPGNNAFSDMGVLGGKTCGVITDRGSHTLAISDATPNPGSGITVVVSGTTTTPAQVQILNTPIKLLDNGIYLLDDPVGTVTVKVTGGGKAQITYTVNGNQVYVVNNGGSATFAETTNGAGQLTGVQAAALAGVVTLNGTPLPVPPPPAPAPNPFAGKLKADLDTKRDRFSLDSTLTLGTGSDGINPATEPMLLEVGGYAVVIPAGSFKADGKSKWTYKGTITGAKLEVDMRHNDDKEDDKGSKDKDGKKKPVVSYDISVKAQNVTAVGVASPITVTIAVGLDGASTTVKLDKDGKGHGDDSGQR